MDLASEYGFIKIVKYLHSVGEIPSECAINRASECGNLELVVYLYETVGAPFNDLAIDWASANGHLEVVNYLEKNLI